MCTKETISLIFKITKIIWKPVEPVEHNITETDPIIFGDADVQNRSSSPASLGPEPGNVNAEKPSSVIFQATGQLKWVK